MFKFTKTSAVTKAWVSLVMAEVYTIEQVPTFFGLRAAVEEVMKELQEVGE